MYVVTIFFAIAFSIFAVYSIVNSSRLYYFTYNQKKR